MGGFSKAVEEQGFQEGYPIGYKEGYQIGIEQGIHGLISATRDLHIPESEILENIKRRFSLTDEQARQYMNEVK